MAALRVILLAAAGFGAVGRLAAQEVRLPKLPADGKPAYSTPATTATGVLQAMASRARVIFAGTVVAVRLPAAEEQAGNASAGFVEVEFRVEQAVVGPAPGSRYVMREWAGLWRDGPRFEVGQRRLVLLRAPGPGGLSSPVDGLDGAIPVTGGGLVAASARVAHAGVAGSRAVLPAPGSASRVDLRWLQAKALRAVSDAGDPVAVAGPGALSRVALGTSPGSLSGEPEMQPELGQVLGMLAAWQGSLDAGH